jgi:hypothetical protein
VTPYPSKYSWRRWRLTERFSSFLYISGITRCGGGVSWSGNDPLGMVYHLPRWGDVLPQRGARLRPYILGKPDWWWICQREQGLRLRGRHRPKYPEFLGLCSACYPPTEEAK